MSGANVSNRLFPSEPGTRTLAAQLYSELDAVPIVSPHGHTDPRWYAENTPFADPSQLMVVPDHYVFRMLRSQGIELDDVHEMGPEDRLSERRSREIWQLFAENYYLFRGTPSRHWIDHVFREVFGLPGRFGPQTADQFYDAIAGALAQPEFKPRALYDRFNIEVIATTDSALDDLCWHKITRDSGWHGRVVPTYRPDAVVDPEHKDFVENLGKLADLTSEDTTNWTGYLTAHRKRRAYFKQMGATATDHGHPTARTEDLSNADAKALFDRVISGACSPEEADRFRGQMLTEMARMSLEDGLVMQIHAGSWRNHCQSIFDRFGPDQGFDIPRPTSFVAALHPLLNAVGLEKELTIILFTLDESVYSRELAPLAGTYPALRLGPAWWFHDSFEGMMRYRELMTETAGFYNTVGFNDDTRAFCSIPARHDVARRVDCAYLATLVTSGRLDEEEAHEVAHDLTYGLAKRAYRL